MKICIIGCGKIGSNMARGLAKKHSLQFYDRTFSKAEALASEIKGEAFNKLPKALEGAEMILLAVRPQNIQDVASQASGNFQKGQILVSLVGGVTLFTLEKMFVQPSLVRAMPNLPVAYGEGVVGLSGREELSSAIKKQVLEAFSSLGYIFWVSEEHIEAVTAMSGSGPAFVAVMIEAMVDAGIAMGFSAEQSMKIALQTVSGTARFIDKTGKHPGEVKWQVAVPRGTTINGLRKLEEGAVRSGIMNTFLGAYERSQEMSK